MTVVAGLLISAAAYLALPRKRSARSENHAAMITWGFVLYVLSFVVSAVWVAPYVSPYLVAWLGPVFGVYVTVVSVGIITFPVLVVFLWIAAKAGARGEIPDAD